MDDYFFSFLSEEETKKVTEALIDPGWVIAKQLLMWLRSKMNSISQKADWREAGIQTKITFCNWDKDNQKSNWTTNGIVMRDKAILDAKGYHQEAVSDIKHQWRDLRILGHIWHLLHIQTSISIRWMWTSALLVGESKEEVNVHQFLDFTVADQLELCISLLHKLITGWYEFIAYSSNRQRHGMTL